MKKMLNCFTSVLVGNNHFTFKGKYSEGKNKNILHSISNRLLDKSFRAVVIYSLINNENNNTSSPPESYI